MTKKQSLITILGPTASGKTHLAVHLAALIKGEIISADSRQVYQGMDIGTGKDLEEFNVNGQQIPYQLIDIHPPGYEYNVFEFQRDFLQAYANIQAKDRQPVLCGGTGMYIDAILKGYHLVQVPENLPLRAELSMMETNDLIERLKSLKKLHNTTDITDRKRLVRAIEIQTFEQQNPDHKQPLPAMDHHVFGIQWERGVLKERITSRLKARLKEGMIEEVQGLLDAGFTAEQLKFYGLEYRFVTQHIMGELNSNDLFQKLNAAIHAYAKRQMTYFRRMEKHGINIHWLKGETAVDEKIAEIMNSSLM
ncbi:tRNA (adenosine(37)-N6)-dimethylallyltransferase MiaA [Persicobacter psychrovividus]|uniref:tRNA dimethylallyltransferase n=1 Tax=Persicobacter psychrovividus TaxID=387638 RepID=A0ABN6LBI6_9BACT|nr:tRNA dimethylallyltransferase 2 [Persicobacter psychrovividus]